MNKRINKIKPLLILFLTSTFLVFNYLLSLSNFINASTQDEISKRQKQIEELEKQIQEYQNQINEKQKQAQSLEREISILNAQISQLKLEIRSLDLAIEETSFEIQQTNDKINQISLKIKNLKNGLAEFIKEMNRIDQENLLAVLLKNRNLSDFFGNLENVRMAQKRAQISLTDLKQLKIELEQKEKELEEKKEEQVNLREIQEIQKQELDSKKKMKDYFLAQTKGEERKYQELIRKTKIDIQNIKEQIQFLLQQGISIEDAIKYAQLASLRVGIRPAFLLAILDVESGLGKNVGKGNWLEDMYQCYIDLGKKARAEEEKAAFFEITRKLGLDPNSVKVSARPYYGCGGAMGPAQFLPSIWLLYEEEVKRLTGHNPPNPWNIEDAFMAAAVKLAAAGADKKTKEAEIKAANIYLSGKSNCTQKICRYYSNLVLNKASEIEKDLSGLSTGLNSNKIFSSL